MGNIILRLNEINCIRDEDYLYYFVSHALAPTLDDLKASHVMAFKKLGRFNFYEQWDKHKDYVVEKLGLSYTEVYRDEDLLHILFYKEKVLNDYLNQKEHINFLERFGYRREMSLDEKLDLLKKRYDKPCPHEIGMFLGYFVEDVIGFLEDEKCKNCIFTGYWRVYDKEERARKLFKKYDISKINSYNNIDKDLKQYMCS